MRQIGTGPDIRRRASRSPAPHPALQAPPAPIRNARSRSRRHSRGRLFAQGKLALAAVAITGFAFFFLVGSGRAGRPPEAILAEIERLAELTGFGLQQVALTGHRFTPDGDIFDAIDLARARTMLSFDSRATQERIEQLPWVERASIERIIPDRLEIRILERAPFALWQMGARSFLVDKSGRVLSAVPAGAMPALPRLAGAGAPSEAFTLYARLAAYPTLLRQVKLAERIGERRWTLRLAGGGAVELPAEDEAEALARAAEVLSSGGARVREIDLRVPGRILLRAPHGGEDQMEPATDAQSATGRS